MYGLILRAMPPPRGCAAIAMEGVGGLCCLLGLLLSSTMPGFSSVAPLLLEL